MFDYIEKTRNQDFDDYSTGLLKYLLPVEGHARLVPWLKQRSS